MWGRTYETLTDMLRMQVETQPDSTALFRVGPEGAVEEMSWSFWLEHAEALAAGLREFGVKPGDRVAVMSRTRVEWLWLDFGLMFARAISVPVFHTEVAAMCRKVLVDATPVVVVVEDVSLIDRWLSESDTDTPTELRHIVVIDSSDLDAAKSGEIAGVCVWSLSQLLEKGRQQPDTSEGDAVVSQDPVTITYTPGTEGEPKGVVLSHANFIAASDGLRNVLDLTTDDRQLLYLPMAHAFGRISVVCSVASGVPIALARSYRLVMDDARQLKPTFLCSIPRLFEKIRDEFEAEEEASTLLHRAAARWAFDQDGGWLDGFKQSVASRLVSSRLRGIFGGRLRFAISGAAPLAVDVGRWFERRGIPVLEGYGMTETAGVTHLNRLSDNMYGTVGRALHGVEVRFAPDGELLIRAGQVSKGYWNRDPSQSRVDAEGWLHTGDLGETDDDGRLSITDRKRDIILTATGKVIAPGPISEALRTHPLVGQVLVHGEKRSYLTALVTLDRDALDRFARDAGLDLAYEELVRHPRVFATVEALFDSVNANLAPHENIRKFAVLDTELSPEGGDLTATQGVRRRVAISKHKALLDSFYSESY